MKAGQMLTQNIYSPGSSSDVCGASVMSTLATQGPCFARASLMTMSLAMGLHKRFFVSLQSRVNVTSMSDIVGVMMDGAPKGRRIAVKCLD